MLLFDSMSEKGPIIDSLLLGVEKMKQTFTGIRFVDASGPILPFGNQMDIALHHPESRRSSKYRAGEHSNDSSADGADLLSLVGDDGLVQ